MQSLFSLAVFEQHPRFWWTMTGVIRQNGTSRVASNRSFVQQVDG